MASFLNSYSGSFTDEMGIEVFSIGDDGLSYG